MQTAGFGPDGGEKQTGEHRKKTLFPNRPKNSSKNWMQILKHFLHRDAKL